LKYIFIVFCILNITEWSK